jgi:hypothetical protein
VLIGAGAGGGYLLVQELTKDKAGSVDAAAPQIASAKDFDPEGKPTPEENPQLVPFAIDGNEGTAWHTETYSSTNLGGKSGVGIYVVLTGAADVSAVEVDARESGWSASIYVADAPGSSLSEWGDPVATGQDLGTSARFEIIPPRRGGAVLLWITHLPSSGRLSVAEVRVG